AGCAGAIRPQADADSFTAAGRSGDTAALARATGANFAAAAQRLCAAGTLRAADLAAFTTLVVRNAEASTEPVVYDDAEQGAEKVILEYAFTDAAPPSEAAIGTAIRCWRQPEAPGCDQGGD
ncbi:MAG TPA: hypothetical protein VLK25_09960, partial [Allosphingosinicella sp.]|nr:hypothetical protein [Allosphingosinicella sp.]